MAARVKLNEDPPVSAKTPAGKPALKQLAGRIRAAHNRIEHGRDEWIEGTLELAAALAEAREEFPSNNEFGDWLDQNNFDWLGKNDRAALIKMAADPVTTRRMLAQTERHSWRLILDEARVPSAGKTEHEQAVERAQNRKIDYIGTDIVGKTVAAPYYREPESANKAVKLDDHRTAPESDKPIPGSEVAAYEDAQERLDEFMQRLGNRLADDILDHVKNAQRLVKERLEELQTEPVMAAEPAHKRKRPPMSRKEADKLPAATLNMLQKRRDSTLN